MDGAVDDTDGECHVRDNGQYTARISKTRRSWNCAGLMEG